MLSWKRRLAVVLLDALLGAFIGPLNLLGLILVAGLSSVSAALGPLLAAAGLFVLPGVLARTDGALWFLLPSFLSTLVLAPILLRHLERLSGVPTPDFRFRAAVAGVVFGFAATIPTVVFGLVGMSLFGKVPPEGMSATGIAGAVFAGGVGFNIVCAPAILVSGSLFGLLNGELVRRLVEPPPPPSPAGLSA